MIWEGRLAWMDDSAVLRMEWGLWETERNTASPLATAWLQQGALTTQALYVPS